MRKLSSSAAAACSFKARCNLRHKALGDGTKHITRVAMCVLSVCLSFEPLAAEAQDWGGVIAPIVGGLIDGSVNRSRRDQPRSDWVLEGPVGERRSPRTIQKRSDQMRRTVQAESQDDAAGAASEPPMKAQVKRDLQAALRSLGLYEGPVDGNIGSKSRKAFAAYQESIGEPSTGFLTASQIKSLRAVAVDAVPSPSSGGESATASNTQTRAITLPQRAGHVFVGSFLREDKPAYGKISDEQRVSDALLAAALKAVVERNSDAIPNVETVGMLAARYLTLPEVKDLFSQVETIDGMTMDAWLSSTTVVAFLLPKASEFERLEILHKFADQYLPKIVAKAAKLPMDIVTTTGLAIGDYDFDQGGFVTYDPPPRVDVEAQFRTTGTLSLSPAPTLIKVPAAEARKLASEIDRIVTLAAFARLNSVTVLTQSAVLPDGTKTFDMSGQEVQLDLTPKRFAVFADKKLEKRMADLEADGVAGDLPALLDNGDSSDEETPSSASGVSSSPKRISETPATKKQGIDTLISSEISESDEFPIRIGGYMPIPSSDGIFHTLNAIAWKRANGAYQATQAEYHRIDPANEWGVIKALSARAYLDWVNNHPGEPTPLDLVQHLAVYNLPEKQIAQLFKDLTDKSFKPYSAPEFDTYHRKWRQSSMTDRLDPESAVELQRRFDKLYRDKLIKQAELVSPRVVLVRRWMIPEYDFKVQGFSLGPDATVGGGSSPITERLDGLGEAQYELPALPDILKMEPAVARKMVKEMLRDVSVNRPYGLFEARFGAIESLKYQMKSDKISFDVRLKVERRSLYLEGSLQTLLLDVKSQPPQPIVHITETSNASVAPETSGSGQETAQLKEETKAALVIDEPQPAVAAVLPSREVLEATSAPVIKPEAEPKPLASLATNAPSTLSLQRARVQYDIVGLHLGMTLPEAETIVSGQMDVAAKLKLAPDNSAMVSTFANATVLVRRDNKEFVALVTQPERSGDNIVAIGRYVFEGLGVYSQDDFLASLEEKYGPPVQRSEPFVYWGGQPKATTADGPCFIQMGGLTGGNWLDNNGESPRWEDYQVVGGNSSFQGPKSMPWLGLRILDLNQHLQYRGCGPSVAAWMPVIGGQIPEFAVWLTDTGAYMDILTSVKKQGGSKPRL